MDRTPAACLARARRSLDGLSVGDALGTTFFSRRAAIATRTLSPREVWPWTDDAIMAVSVVEELAATGDIDEGSLGVRFARRYAAEPWRGYGGTAHGILAELGQGVPWREAASRPFDGQGSKGNGAAMRVAPLGAYFAHDLDAVVAAAASASARPRTSTPRAWRAGWRSPWPRPSPRVRARASWRATAPRSWPRSTSARRRARSATASARPCRAAGGHVGLRAYLSAPRATARAGRRRHRRALPVGGGAPPRRLRRGGVGGARRRGDADTNCAIVGGIVAAGGADLRRRGWRSAAAAAAAAGARRGRGRGRGSGFDLGSGTLIAPLTLGEAPKGRSRRPGSSASDSGGRVPPRDVA
ncbi:MAG: ADP-ribosylglycohydrolase family protein [Kofleriaceae bacterium]|nr:ADP-ribosylglycohydrolase family protein [Kofleriaceae bacterium]